MYLLTDVLSRPSLKPTYEGLKWSSGVMRRSRMASSEAYLRGIEMEVSEQRPGRHTQSEAYLRGIEMVTRLRSQPSLRAV